jgi:hypothetical protein
METMQPGVGDTVERAMEAGDWAAIGAEAVSQREKENDDA